MSTGTSKRFTAQSDAASLLRLKFLDGEIDIDNPDSTLIYESEPEFFNFYSKRNFKGNIDRMAQSIKNSGGIDTWAALNRGKCKCIKVLKMRKEHIYN